MNRLQRGPSHYGGGSAQGQSSFADPAGERAAAARAFFPAPGGGEQSAASAAAMGSPRQRQHYGGGDEISLGHGHGHGQHHYHQFGVEARDDGGGSSGPPGLLPRHSSSPPGFFSSLVVDDNGFSSARAGVGGGGDQVRQAMNNKKKKSPLNFARQGTDLSQISEDGIPDLTDNLHGAGRSEENIAADHVVRSFPGGFSIGSWEDSNSIVFSKPTGRPGRHNNDDIIATLSNYETQFIMPREMAGADHKYLQMQQDQVPFRARAKRGCATHPRSIAERERRTRISEKLRKLQALVPNMDKQTSTADMLDLAVEHIRGLQNQLQVLKGDKEKCTCRGKQASRN